MVSSGIIFSRLSYGTGTTLTSWGVSAKVYDGVTQGVPWMLTDKIEALSLNDWAILVGIACTVITCGVNWYYRHKDREDRLEREERQENDDR
ncbi:TPA: holin [Escherichia coli]|nr:HP1 family phage holin [Escherichia coli]HEL8025844.1 holin [Escherichia coli]HEL8044522.1 holin [Escherichia coli]HEL8049394.1 holin [Escherichia coli]HEL8054176.1 holin [Escherichia coli]